ncbi:UNVERIFIED_CONTAM: pyridoxal phosphate synthase yaaE subunit [Acetivibrio alkalicellulosi]
MLVNIGVLAFQGSVIEHMNSLSRLKDVNPLEVKTLSELNTVDGLILPGGESTTIGKLLRDFELAPYIIERINMGMPVWGTCAGMILLARKIAGGENPHLDVMDIVVRRNAYGGQLDSFSTNVSIPEIAESQLPLVFIRAPWIEEVSEKVKVLCKINDKIVAARQDNMFVTSFHPELTENLEFHKYFAGIVAHNMLEKKTSCKK